MINLLLGSIYCSMTSFDLKCVDANQKWDVEEAIDWMKELAPYQPHWIEEPTSPDDVLGHARIAQVSKFT